MGSVTSETFNTEIHQPEIDQETSRLEQVNWLLNAPDPPGICKEFISTIKQTIFPHHKNPSWAENQTPWKIVFSFLQSLFQILNWGKNYNTSMFRNDLMSGLTLASLSIPQSIGYANLAKLAPQYGLYTSVVPPLIYAMMGSSREIAIGPVAVVSLLVSSLVVKYEDAVNDPIGYRSFVFTATFFAGVFQTAFGLFRLGFLVDFLSHSAIVGFMGGAAVVIGLQQLKGLLGINHFSTNTDAISVLKSVFQSIHHPWYPLNFVLGCSFLIFILIARFIGRKKKKLFWLSAIAPLISVILSTLIVYLTRADNHGVKIVKHIKQGLNPSSVHQLQFNSSNVGKAAKVGLISAIVALTEAIAVGRSFASIKGYHLDGNKEMVAMGFMNIIGSLTSCYVATGSFSRTAVNYSAGCQTAVSNIVMAITVILSLVLFTKLLYFTPVAILASIILSALPGLIDINGAYYIWKVDKLDFLVCIATFLGVLFASVEIGLLVAVSISFCKILLNSIRPGTEVLGRLPRTNIFCDITQYPKAITIPGILIIRINSALLCFANSNFIKERIMNWATEEMDDKKENAQGRIQVVILDMSSMMNIDTSGIIVLEELHKKLLSHGLELAIANPKWKVIHKLKISKFAERIGKEWIFLTVNEAVDACLGSKLACLSCC